MSRLYIPSADGSKPNFILNAFVSALLCALPFTFPDLYLLPWIGTVPFFASIMSDAFFAMNKKRSFGVGFVWGFFYCAFIYYWFLWLYPLDFAGLTPLEAALVVGAAWLGISAYQALFTGASTLVIRLIGKKAQLFTKLFDM